MQSMSALKEICPDYENWPSTWMGVKEDLICGRELIELFRPFIEQVITSKLSFRSQKKHIDNLWLLGGELIKDASINDEYNIPAKKLLLDSIDHDGGPISSHLESEASIKSFDNTCRDLYGYLSLAREKG